MQNCFAGTTFPQSPWGTNCAIAFEPWWSWWHSQPSRLSRSLPNHALIEKPNTKADVGSSARARAIAIVVRYHCLSICSLCSLYGDLGLGRTTRKECESSRSVIGSTQITSNTVRRTREIMPGTKAMLVRWKFDSTPSYRRWEQSRHSRPHLHEATGIHLSRRVPQVIPHDKRGYGCGVEAVCHFMEYLLPSLSWIADYEPQTVDVRHHMWP